MHAHSYKATALLAGALILATGCSKSSETKNKTGRSVDRGVVEPGQNPNRPNQIEVDATLNAQGSYAFELTSLSAELAPNVKGLGKIHVRGDQFEVSVKVEGVEAYSSHAQYLHTGASCPDLTSDSNADEFLDSAEALMASGKILIPFDGDLSAQLLDSNVFPSANGLGKYSYLNSSALSLMIGDLRIEDENTNDSYAKLALDETINFEGRTVIVYGIPTSVQVPGTIRPFNRLNRQASMPIACGKVVRVVEEVL
jgi:hypothetical protein